VLGVSCDYHDSAAAVIVDGQVVAAAEEERFSRTKHDSSLPKRAVASCLAVAGVGVDDVDVVAFYERPLTVLHRFMATRRRTGLNGFTSFVRDAPQLISTNLMVGYRLERMLRGLGRRPPVDVRYIEHHLSHAAAAFYPSPFSRAAVLTIDGIGEWTTASISRGIGNRIDVIDELRFPDSIGLVYSAITWYCGFTPNDGEYKLMGLAPYGEPRFVEQLDQVLDVLDDGSVRVDASALNWFRTGRRLERKLAEMFDGPRRESDAPLTQRDADVAASMQAVTERVVLGLARRAADSTSLDALCLAGGVALNCTANGRLLREGPFDDVWIQPAAGDDGGAIGAALACWYQHSGAQRTPSGEDGMSGAFLGPAADADEVAAWAPEAGVSAERLETLELRRRVAAELADGAIVGWVQGRMEFGPRALGHRSILADARSSTVHQRLNLAVKGREGFRPFAPAVLADHAAEWFDLDRPSPYMLVVVPVAESRLIEVDEEPDSIEQRAKVVRSSIPACTHVDGSARVQTVTADANPEFHALLEEFDRQTGCPVLLNTSFNRAGEPIVATPDDALGSAQQMGLDLLVVDDWLFDLRSDEATSSRSESVA